MSQPDFAASMVTTAAMAGIFAPVNQVQQILIFEAALARAEAASGLIPITAADAIAAACRVGAFDLPALSAAASSAGTLAIPLVRALTELAGPDAGRYVHFGATSQDALDTALMLQSRAALDLLLTDLLAICADCAALAEQHRRTLLAGRTLLQHAVPITFGLKAARWLALLTRQVQALRRCRSQQLALQFGGAAGTLAALGSHGLAVAAHLAAELDLPLPDLPWHAESDRVAALAAALGITAGSVAKIATDIALMSQTEVAELAEAAAPGKGGSSAMPQKRNPVDATFALAAARLALGGVPLLLNAMTQEHERGVGGWQAEWSALPDLFRHTAGAVARLHGAIGGLQVDTERMRANLELTNGAIMAESLLVALAEPLGRPQAQQLVQRLVAQLRPGGPPLLAIALAEPAIIATLTPAALAQALNPANYLGSSDTLIDRALAAYHAEEA